MRFSSVFFGLVASVSAVDIWLWSENECSGVGVGCRNIDYNVCCVANGINVGYYGFLTGVRMKGFSGGGCNNLAGELDNNGQINVCMLVVSRESYTGAGYYAPGSKRSVNETCDYSVKPDTLVAAGGATKYDIVGLDDAKVDELVSMPNSPSFILPLFRADQGPPTRQSWERITS